MDETAAFGSLVEILKKIQAIQGNVHQLQNNFKTIQSYGFDNHRLINALQGTVQKNQNLLHDLQVN